MRYYLIILCSLLWTDPLLGANTPAHAQDNTAHMYADITVDLSGVPETISYENVIIRLNGSPIGAPDMDGKISVPLDIGEVRLEALVQGQGSSSATFKVIPEIKGRQPIKLTPNLAELLKDDLVAQNHNAHYQDRAQIASALGTDLDIPPNARFRLVSLHSWADIGPTHLPRDVRETYCKTRVKMMAQRICRQIMLGTKATRHKVYSSPDIDAPLAGTLIKVSKVGYGSTYFQPEGAHKLHKIPFDYVLSDWGYSGFGYAVQVRGLENGYVAIQLPHTGEIGWTDLDDLLNRNVDESQSYPGRNNLEDTYLGFSPVGCDAYIDIKNESFRVLKFDQDFIYYRDIQAAHDNWNIYNYETPRPPLEPFKTHKVDWRAGYDVEGNLTFLPHAAKEC